MSGIKFIYFDMANTLVHQPDFYTDIYDLLVDQKLNVSLDDLRKAHRQLSEEIQFPDKTNQDFYLMFNEKWLNKMNLNPNDSLVEEFYKRGKGHSWKPFDDTFSLSEIEIPKGIISNWDNTLPDRIKDFFEFEFNPIIGSYNVGFQKPDKRIFELAVTRCGFQPDEILMVGDSIRLDIQPALNSGFNAVLIDRDDIFTNFNGCKIRNLQQLKEYL